MTSWFPGVSFGDATRGGIFDFGDASFLGVISLRRFGVAVCNCGALQSRAFGDDIYHIRLILTFRNHFFVCFTLDIIFNYFAVINKNNFNIRWGCSILPRSAANFEWSNN